MFIIGVTGLEPISLSGRWEEAGEPGKNPHEHWENMETAHRKEANNSHQMNRLLFLTSIIVAKVEIMFQTVGTAATAEDTNNSIYDITNI